MQNDFRYAENAGRKIKNRAALVYRKMRCQTVRTASPSDWRDYGKLADETAPRAGGGRLYRPHRLSRGAAACRIQSDRPGRELFICS